MVFASRRPSLVLFLSLFFLQQVSLFIQTLSNSDNYHLKSNNFSFWDTMLGTDSVARSKRGYDDYPAVYHDYPSYSPKPPKAYKVQVKGGDVWEIHKFQHYGYKSHPPPPFKSSFGSIAPILALLAPLATIPVIASALTTMATIMPGGIIPTVTTTAGKRRRRDAVAQALILGGQSPPTDPEQVETDQKEMDAIQKYLRKVRPDGDYNDEVVATYLKCSGMLDEDNQCLERLVCQFSNPSGGMSDLEKEVASLIIYAILTNKHIDIEFKARLRKAASIGKEGGVCPSRYFCVKTEQSSYGLPSRSRG